MVHRRAFQKVQCIAISKKIFDICKLLSYLQISLFLFNACKEHCTHDLIYLEVKPGWRDWTIREIIMQLPYQGNHRNNGNMQIIIIRPSRTQNENIEMSTIQSYILCKTNTIPYFCCRLWFTCIYKMLFC